MEAALSLFDLAMDALRQDARQRNTPICVTGRNVAVQAGRSLKTAQLEFLPHL